MRQGFFTVSPKDVPSNIEAAYPKLMQHRSAELGAIEHTFGVQLTDLAKYYVVPEAQQVNPADTPEDNSGLISRQPVLYQVDSFFASKDRGQVHAVVLSDAGMGKSSLLLMLRLAYLAKLVDERYSVELLKLSPMSTGAIKSIPHPSSTVLLLDALDEDPEAWTNLNAKLDDTFAATQAFHRVLITCRTQFFPSKYEKDGRKAGFVNLNGFECFKTFLSPFSDEQVEEYLGRKFALEEQRRKAFSIVAQMQSLKFRPMLLSYIELLLDREQAYQSIYDLYDALVDEWLNRELRKRVLQAEDKQAMLEACTLIALDMFQTMDQSVGRDRLEQLCAANASTRHLEEMSVHGRSLLHRKSDGTFKFAHYSILEYLVARSLLREPRPLRCSDQIKSFIVDRIHFGSAKRLQDLDLAAASMDGINAKGLEGSRVSLEAASLTNCHLSHSVLREANLSHAVLHGCILDNVNLSNANLQHALFENCRLREIISSDAVIDKAELENVDAEGLVVSGLAGKGIQIRSGKFNDASIVGLSLNDAAISKSSFDGALLQRTTLQKTAITDVTAVASKWETVELIDCNASGLVMDGASLMGVFLSGTFADIRLSGGRLAKLVATRATLAALKMSGASVEDAVLTAVDLSGAILTDLKIQQLHAESATLNGANFDSAELGDSLLTGLRATGASFRNIRAKRWRSPHAHLVDSDFTHAILDDADFRHTAATRARFLGASLLRADFRSADLRDADLSNVNLSTTSLVGASLSGARFVGSTIRSLRGYDLRRCVFRDAQLDDADLSEAKLQQADFSGASATGIRLQGADLDRSVFVGAKLQNSFLSRAVLTNSDLRGADLTGAKVDGASFAGCIVDAKTRLPSALSADQILQLQPTRIANGPSADAPNGA